MKKGQMRLKGDKGEKDKKRDDRNDKSLLVFVILYSTIFQVY